MRLLGTHLRRLICVQRVFWLALVAICVARGAAQEMPIPDHPRFSFQSVPEGLGLSTATVTSLVQDRDGFLWIGTQAGLFRYDGLTVTRFGEEQWLRSSYITQLVISPSGELWVATHLGIWRYAGGRFTELAVPATAKVSRGGRQILAVDSKNIAFVATDKGVLRVKVEDPVDKELIATSGPVAAICRTPDDTIVAAWQDSVGRLRPQEHALELLPEKITDEMYALVADADNTIWARTEKHFSYWDNATRHWVLEDEKLPGANDFGYPTVDRDGEILLPTSDGLYRHVNGKWQATSLTQGMASNAVSAATEDRDGAIWVGYVGAGIDRWPGRKEWVGWSTAEGLPDAVVWTVTRDNHERLWVGTNNGLSMWDPKTHAWRVWKVNDGLAVGAIFKMAVAADESLWALSASGGLTRIDLKTFQVSQIQPPNPAAPNFLGLAQAPNGSVWVSGRGFVNRLGLGAHFAEFTPLEVPKDAVYTTAAMSYAKDGTLWTAGHGGVMRFDGKTWVHVGLENGLRMKAVGTVWAASRNEAWVTYMEPKGATRIHVDDSGHVAVRQYGVGDGLPSNSLSLITGDRHGNIWLGGNHGISVLHPDGVLTNYDRDSGLLWNDVNGGGFYEDADGGVFIGTSRGLSYRKPNAKDPEKRVPSTILTSASFSGKESLREEEPRVEHKNGTFEAQFAAPVFQNAAELKCRYQLQGLDKEPVETKLREVRYTALPAGSYGFQVSCGSPANGWGTPARYGFVVLSPWWQRWWALGLGGVLALLLLRWIIDLRTRALEKDRQRLEEAVEERNAELAAANRRLEEMTLTDPLTGVQNRRFFDLTVPRQAQQTLRAYKSAGPEHPPQDRDLILFFVDLDHFKKVNDKYGHASGDRVLVEVVRRLNGVVRQVDALVRWGGEEFVIASEGSNRESAQQMAQRILEAVAAKPFDLGESGELRLTCSVGWAPYPWLVKRPEEFGMDQVIIFADRGLYLAKSEGRNRAVGVLPAPERKTTVAIGAELADFQFVRDAGPSVDGPGAGVNEESVVR
jgi:diguanylate cyclase (GGDEF)-like protein